VFSLARTGATSALTQVDQGLPTVGAAVMPDRPGREGLTAEGREPIFGTL